jgi:hypothetical protein
MRRAYLRTSRGAKRELLRVVADPVPCDPVELRNPLMEFGVQCLESLRLGVLKQVDDRR